ncbi:uncharacterized protein H6S33_013161 [Morchella sextelata]|uniref:uncharacterized protein n=1 Tax=Morchella sextelata TaxID=1174677 RepID=UPI001D0461E2|nr:uncharacterized protein H6S33_013161 [Morchella sextelata]KAH0609675.1 hypothetical protein H6S33_013161 [Morchella sextelata]
MPPVTPTNSCPCPHPAPHHRHSSTPRRSLAFTRSSYSAHFERHAEGAGAVGGAAIHGGRGPGVTGQALATCGLMARGMIRNPRRGKSRRGRAAAHAGQRRPGRWRVSARVLAPTQDRAATTGDHYTPQTRSTKLGLASTGTHRTRCIGTAARKKSVNPRRKTLDRAGEPRGSELDSQPGAGPDPADGAEETDGYKKIVFRGLNDMAAPIAPLKRVCANATQHLVTRRCSMRRGDMAAVRGAVVHLDGSG